MSAEFKTTLLREKFTLRDPSGELSDSPPVVALSNRMVLPLARDDGQNSETFVIRTQNMHSCARLAAAIAKEYADRGMLTRRGAPFQWDLLWNDVIKGYEKDWNPDIWCAVYYKGRVVFEDGEHHPFLDIIEKCDAVSRDGYTESVQFAEQAFQQAGKTVKIDHDSNIALVISVKDEEAKGGVILRGANRKTTFNYTISQKKNAGGEPVRVPTILTLSAAFLEGVQLAFNVGMINRKRATGLIEKYSDDDRKGKRGTERLTGLSQAIESVERKYNCNYRPDRPNFRAMVRDAEEFANKFLRPEIEAKLASGELDAREWIT